MVDDWKKAILGRLAAARLDPASEADVVEELAQHLEDRYRELLAGGVPEQESRRRALAELDDRGLLAGGARRARRSSLVGTRNDLKIALRNLRTHPWFSLMVVGMLAVGIAGNAAMFSVFDALFLRPLPFEQSGRLVELDETAPQWRLKYVGVASPDFDRWQKNNSTFDSMAFFTGVSYNLSGGAVASRVEAAQVTRDMLDVLRLKPLIGRNFLPREDRPGGAKVALLSYGLWRRLFQGDRNVVGRILKLDEQPYAVVGVLPPSAVFPDRTDLWTPLAIDSNVPSGYYLNGIGRLKAGVSMEQARADLMRIHKAMIPARRVNEITSPIVTPLRDRYLGDFKTVSRALLAAVGMVLLIVCVNIAALMTVRGSSRAREIAIRTAMGASRRRIAAQLLTENIVLGAAGFLAGVPLGAACLRAMISRLPEDMPRWIGFSLDWRFVTFCILVTGAAVLLFGLSPVFEASRIDIRAALQNAAARATATRARRLALGGFVVCEIAVALMLSIGAGLLAQAFRSVLHADPGFRPENVLTFGASLPDATYAKNEQRISYYDALLARLRELPGVQAAGAASAPPLGGHWGGQFEAEGGLVRRRQENPVVLRIAATPGYFDAIGMTLLEGRIFDQRDCRPNSPRVTVVNESFAKTFWNGASPVGKRIRYPGGTDWHQVIGLLRDEKHDGLDQPAKPSVFLPYSAALAAADQNDLRSLRLMTVVLRASSDRIADPAMLAGPARDIMMHLDPDIPMYAVQAMTERLDRSLWARRAYSWLFGAFAAIAILLAAAGVYGMVSYVVSQRTQEIGIRVALGARPDQVLRQVLSSGMTLAAIGVGCGLLAALQATRLLSAMLFGVSAHDPLIYTAAVLGVFAIALLANLVPARRAAKIDPIQALRS